MRWRRRTDDARRMKGDPPPTYARLAGEIARLTAAVGHAEEMAVNLRHQCDGLIRENDGLRAQNRALRESNLRLLNDANQMRQRLPRLATAFDRTPVLFWICPVEGHTVVEWRGNVAHCMTYGCGRHSLADQLRPLAVDPVVTRPYIPDYGVPATEDPTVLEHDPWKDETR